MGTRRDVIVRTAVPADELGMRSSRYPRAEERVDLGVGLLEAGVGDAVLRGEPAGQRDHLARQIHPEGHADRPERSRAKAAAVCAAAGGGVRRGRWW
jgi:hypothetical protein